MRNTYEDPSTVESIDGSHGGTGLDTIKELKTRIVIQGGIRSVADAVRLSLAGVEDMLDGNLTAQEATVVNTACGRVLKGVELYLKYGRGKNKNLEIPSTKELHE